MAQATDFVADRASGNRRENAQRLLVWGVVVALLLRLANNFGFDSLFGALGGGVEAAIGYLPWAGVVVAAFGLATLILSPDEGQRGPQRLAQHAIAWGIGAFLLLLLGFGGDTVATPIAAVLGKFGSIVVGFSETHGVFLAAICAIIGIALWFIGTTDLSVGRPGMVERVWVQNITAKIAGVPMVLTSMGIFVGATLWTVFYSFTGSRMLPSTKWVGLDQYERLWGTNNNRWWVSIEHLGLYAIIILTTSLVIGFILAALLDQKIRFENTFRTILLYPFALSFIVTGLVWQWLLNPNFGVEKVVRSLGFESFTFDPLFNPDYVMYGICIAALWHGTGLVMCLMLAGLRGIDEDIWKAARVDGIPMWKTYIFIVIPMMRAVFITTIVLITSGILRVYDLVVAQTSGGPGIASEVPAKYVYDYMFGGQNLGQGFAASTMMLVAVLPIVAIWAFIEFGGRRHG